MKQLSPDLTISYALNPMNIFCVVLILSTQPPNLELRVPRTSNWG